MYQPEVKEELIRKLYLLKLKEKRPMTKLMNEAVEQYLSTKQSLKLEVTNEPRS